MIGWEGWRDVMVSKHQLFGLTLVFGGEIGSEYLVYGVQFFLHLIYAQNHFLMAY
jgi:hypothetical protein